MPWSLSVSNIIGCLSDDILDPSGRKGPAPHTARPTSHCLHEEMGDSTRES